MAANNENADRRVVPRWRTFREALATNELSSHVIATIPKINGEPFLKEKESQWLDNKELPFAIDLVSASTVLGYSETAKSAATFILENSESASQSAQNLARNILGIVEPKESQFEHYTPSQIVQDVKKLKAQRLAQPLNAFVWLDLSRLYVLLGQIESAHQAMRVALALAPTERFVIRCAVRFFLHCHKPDEAVHLLRSNPRTPTDPWLIAAEVAVSSILEKTPKFVSKGRAVLKNQNLSHFHKSELASSLGSMEMFAGSHRKATNLIIDSLKQPTDNSLAQAVWASKRLGLEINKHLLQTQNATEARAFNASNLGEWATALGNATMWAHEESFSARPRLLASFIASTMLGRFDLAEEITKEGLKTNIRHPALINNMAFALIGQNKPNDAMKWIAQADPKLMTPTDAICLVATTGLAFFRLGNPAEGKKYYEMAITAAIQHNNPTLKVLAKLYLARELVLQGNTDAAAEFKKAFNDANKFQATNLPQIAERLEKQLFGSRISDKPSLFSKAKKLLY